MTEPTPDPELHPETRAVRGGRTGSHPSLAPVIWATSTFVSDSVEEAQAAALSIGSDRFYSRYGNPTVADFERAVADLEGAEAARAFGSGMGAVTAVVLGLCSQGDHIVASKQLYAGTQLVFQAMCPRFGIDVTFVDGTEPGAMAAAVRPGKTMLVWAETPANPRLDLVDLDELGAIAGPMTVVDSTFATPLGQTPLAHGVDIVVHSATKAMAGHNDATLGVVATSAELVQWLTGFAVLQGSTASPYDAANGLRGLRTLPVRFARQSETALELARWLEKDGRAVAVRHPGLESHPQHDLALRQMRALGGLVCFDLPGGIEAGKAFVESVEIAQLASSLGGPETLVTHPASTTHVNLLPDELAEVGIGPGTIRMSVGLEHVDDLRADLDRALAAAGGAAGVDDA
jgi:cystathionine beta-lyase/cystathionine gamma-synthase